MKNGDFLTFDFCQATATERSRLLKKKNRLVWRNNNKDSFPKHSMFPLEFALKIKSQQTQSFLDRILTSCNVLASALETNISNF